MDGTSAREQQTIRQYPIGAPVNSDSSSGDLTAFHDDLLSWLHRELTDFETFIVLADPRSCELRFDALRSTCLPPGISSVWLKSHIERHPSLQQKISQGELVGISCTEASTTPRPVKNARASVVLVPVFHECSLLGAFGIVSWMDGPQPTAENLQTIRRCAIEAAPMLSRVLEVERLQMDNSELKDLVQRLWALEQTAVEAAALNTQLEAKAQMRTYLHSNIAHDLRTPLAAVRGYSRMMIDGRAGEVNERQREYLTIVIENANKMIDLVSWMSEIFDTAEHQLKVKEVDFRHIWTQCLNESEQDLSLKSLTLTQDIPDEPFNAIADGERILQLFRQVLHCAIHFSDKGAALNVKLSHGREGEITFKLHGITQEIPGEMTMRDRKPLQASPHADFELDSVYDNAGMHGGRFFIRRTSEEGSVLLVTFPEIRSQIHQGSAHP